MWQCNRAVLQMGKDNEGFQGRFNVRYVRLRLTLASLALELTICLGNNREF